MMQVEVLALQKKGISLAKGIQSPYANHIMASTCDSKMWMGRNKEKG